MIQGNRRLLIKQKAQIGQSTKWLEMRFLIENLFFSAR
jgi:hypothetical protein